MRLLPLLVLRFRLDYNAPCSGRLSVGSDTVGDRPDSFPGSLNEVCRITLICQFLNMKRMTLCSILAYQASIIVRIGSPSLRLLDWKLRLHDPICKSSGVLMICSIHCLDVNIMFTVLCWQANWASPVLICITNNFRILSLGNPAQEIHWYGCTT